MFLRWRPPKGVVRIASRSHLILPVARQRVHHVAHLGRFRRELVVARLRPPQDLFVRQSLRCSSAMYRCRRGPGVGLLERRLLTADVTNTVSPQTIGDDQPWPATGTAHLTCSVGDHRSGNARRSRPRRSSRARESRATFPPALGHGRGKDGKAGNDIGTRRRPEVSRCSFLRLSKTNRSNVPARCRSRRSGQSCGGGDRDHIVGIDAGLRRALTLPRRSRRHDEPPGFNAADSACRSRVLVDDAERLDQDHRVHRRGIERRSRGSCPNRADRF